MDSLRSLMAAALFLAYVQTMSVNVSLLYVHISGALVYAWLIRTTLTVHG